MTRRPGSAGGWRDSAAGPLVRPYAVTQGRTRAAEVELDRTALVMRTGQEPPDETGADEARPDEMGEWSADHERILRLCARPTSVTDIAASLQLPVMVAKVLVSDLLRSGELTIPLPAVQEPDYALLQAVLDGIRRL